MPSATPPELRNPWRAFLVDVDRQVPRPIEIHCLGGFVAALYYDLPRPTNDLDYIEVIPHDAMAALQEIAGIESPLARKHRVHFQHVGEASVPESYAERLTEPFPETFRRLRLFTLEPHDLALSKLPATARSIAMTSPSWRRPSPWIQYSFARGTSWSFVLS